MRSLGAGVAQAARPGAPGRQLPARVRPNRPGSSLAELVVALALFGVIGAATLRVLDRQARFHTGLLTILEARSQHAATHEMIATELRGVSPSGGDIARLSDTAVVFRAPIGGGVVCAVHPTGIDFAPDSVASGQTLARLRSAPQRGDTLWLLDEGATMADADDRWHPVEVASASRSPGHCAGTPLADSALDGARPGWAFALASGASVPVGVRPGAPARLTRHSRFALYRAGTGEYHLGFAELNAVTGTWNVIQPVSGPFLPFYRPAPSASGIAFGGRDSSGAALATGAGVPAGVSLATRSVTGRAVRMDGVARGPRGDSLATLIALRNAR